MTIKKTMSDLETLRFHNLVKRVLLNPMDDGSWLVQVEAENFDNWIHLVTARGQIRNFKTLDSAYKAALNIVKTPLASILESGDLFPSIQCLINRD